MSANRWTTYLFCLVCIAACSKEVAEVRYIGKIKHTEIFSSPAFDLDSYHRPLVRQSFCTVDTLLCLEAGGLGGGLRWSTYDSESAGKLLVTLETDAQEKPTTGTYLFDTKTGTQIVCAGCGWENEQFYARAWLKEGNVLFASEASKKVGPPRIRVVEINGGNATQRFVDRKKIDGKGTKWFLSPSASALAAFKCSAQNCWLSWFAGKLNKEHLESVNCAKEPEYLTVYWDDDKPHIAQTVWATGVASRHRCTDANGRPMYPILNRDVYTEGRSATAADIMVGE